MNRPLPSHIPSLNGLRAISIAMVLIGHLVGTRNFLSSRWLWPIDNLGTLGVRIFFVISGFLITTLLLKEWNQSKTISLKHFYLRRTFRIFPAFYVYVAAIFVLHLLGRIALLPGDLLHALTYTMNFHYQRSWYMGHIWSLSVEEQFYLLWPLTLLLVGKRRGLWVPVLVCLAGPMIRVGYWYLLPAYRVGIGEAFPTIADAIAAGCLLAGSRDWLACQRWYRFVLSSPFFFCIPLLAWFAYEMSSHAISSFLIGETLMNVCIVFTIDWCVRFPSGIVGRVLNSALFSYVGVLSYSLYLWQQPFLNRHSISILAVFPLNIILVFAIAMLSYYVVEKPFLKLKSRIEGPQRTAPSTSQSGSFAGTRHRN